MRFALRLAMVSFHHCDTLHCVCSSGSVHSCVSVCLCSLAPHLSQVDCVVSRSALIVSHRSVVSLVSVTVCWFPAAGTVGCGWQSMSWLHCAAPTVAPYKCLTNDRLIDWLTCTLQYIDRQRALSDCWRFTSLLTYLLTYSDICASLTRSVCVLVWRACVHCLRRLIYTSWWR